MRLLANPIVLRMALVFFIATSAFIIGVLLMRRIKHSLTEEASLDQAAPSPQSFPLQTYNAVIQQLKQQKHELQVQQQAERRRLKAAENISAVVLSHLSCGVLFFNPAGLVRQANHAAKSILGFASPLGMNAGELFRDAKVRSAPGSAAEASVSMAETLQSTLRAGTALRRVEAEYSTPAGEQRVLDVTLSPVQSSDGELLGAACLVSDQTEFARLQRQQELRGEMSAEMALELKSSLATISGYAQQLASSRDPHAAGRLAQDIAAEAARLDRTIVGFLAGAGAAKTASEGC